MSWLGGSGKKGRKSVKRPSRVMKRTPPPSSRRGSKAAKKKSSNWLTRGVMLMLITLLLIWVSRLDWDWYRQDGDVLPKVAPTLIKVVPLQSSQSGLVATVESPCSKDGKAATCRYDMPAKRFTQLRSMLSRYARRAGPETMQKSHVELHWRRG